MKKIYVFIFLFALCVATISMHTFASTTATFSGPDTVRAGDTVTLTFRLNGNNILGVSGTLSYDTNQVALVSTKQSIGTSWTVEFSGNNFVAYDNDFSNPIRGNTALFTATFKVKSISPATKIRISCTDVKASDGTADQSVSVSGYSKTIVAPLGTNNNLETLTVGNATISPAFSAETTNYTASVPFEISKLDVSATSVDNKAKVSVHSPNLIPNGTTNVTITVTAENGTKKTYTIAVTRAKDPNYVPSSNNALSGITVDGFLLSPAFTSENTRYVIWVPYETEKIKINGFSSDDKASVSVEGGETLAAGQDNLVKVICTAENGEKKEYLITVKRATAHDGSTEEFPEDTSTDTKFPPTDTTTDTLVNSVTDSDSGVSIAQRSGLAWWWLIVSGIIGIALGIALEFFIVKFSKKNR